MKILLLLAWLFSAPAFASGHASTSAVTVNPSAGAVLATTGSLSSGLAGGSANYLFQILVSSTVAEVFDFQSVFNSSVVSHTYIMVPAMTSFNFSVDIPFNVPDAITLNVVAVNAVTGTVQANLYWLQQSGT